MVLLFSREYYQYPLAAQYIAVQRSKNYQVKKNNSDNSVLVKLSTAAI